MRLALRSRSSWFMLLVVCHGFLLGVPNVLIAQSTVEVTEEIRFSSINLSVSYNELGVCKIKQTRHSFPNYAPQLAIFTDPALVPPPEVDREKVDSISKEVIEIREAVQRGEIKIEDFRVRTSGLEAQVNELLSEEQRRECQMIWDTTDFYRFGPIEFVKQRGASEEQLAIVRRRMDEFVGHLTGRLRRIEDKRLKQLFDSLPPDKLAPLVNIAIVNQARHAAISPLINSLSSLIDGEYTHSGTLDLLPRFQLALGPRMMPFDPQRRDDVGEKLVIMKMFESRLGLGNVVDAGQRRHREIVQSRELEQKKVDTSSYTPEANRLRQEQRKQINDKYQVMLDELRTNLDSKLEGEFQTAAGRIQFMTLVSRIGPTALFSNEAESCLGTTYGPEEFKALATVAATVRQDLLKDCLGVQREFVEFVFLSGELPVEMDANFEWVNRASQTYIPPVDLLAEYCKPEK